MRKAVFSLLVAVLVASCASANRVGGAAAPHKGIAQPVGPAPTSIEGAQADIAHWQAVLNGAPSQAAPPTGTGTAGEAPTQPGSAPSSSIPTGPTTPSAPAPVARPESAPQGGAGAEQSSSADICATPCQAIASMRRSVGVLCDLSGEDDARCQEARKVLADSEQRVAPCGC